MMHLSGARLRDGRVSACSAGGRMHDLERIEHALATKRLSAEVFERCAQDLLSTVYAGLTPIPGGTDWGRDADIASTADEVPVRLLVTSSRLLEGVRKNMLAGIASMKEDNVRFRRIVLANPALLRLADRQKLVESAKRSGAVLDASDVFDRGISRAVCAGTVTGVRRCWGFRPSRSRCRRLRQTWLRARGRSCPSWPAART